MDPFLESVSKTLLRNRKLIESAFAQDDDLFIRKISIGQTRAFLVGISGIVDKHLIAETIIAPLSRVSDSISINSNVILINLSCPVVIEEDKLDRVIELIMMGQVALFVDELSTAFMMDVAAVEQRGVTEPSSETLVRGPHAGFIENLVVNLSLVRRNLADHRLKIEISTLGNTNKKKVAVLYLEGIAHQDILQKVRADLASISIDSILDSGYIEQLFERFSLFPTVGHTERPDAVVADLLEGRVGILVDGSPAALIVPHLFFDNITNPEDYYSRPYYSSLMRIVRFLAFLMAVNLPSFYISLENFHKEFLPSSLLVSIAGAREGVPFPLALETLLMIFTFELLKESGIRMPQPIGQAISIVGALIVGQAAVDAGFIGIPTVIIVAVAGISSFLIPTLAETTVLLRILLIPCAAFVGLYGLLLINIMILLHAVSLDSFGVPYLAPLSPTYFRDWKDTLIRLPIAYIHSRDKQLRHNIGRYLQ